MGKPLNIVVDTSNAPPSRKRPNLAAAGASAVSLALAFVIVGWGVLRSATTARA